MLLRRYARTLILIAILVAISAVVLGIQKIKIGDFERGGDTVLGLSLGLDLQGGSHLVYQAVDTLTGEPITPSGDEMEALKRSIERRVNKSGLGEPIIQLLGDDQLLVQLPGVRDLSRAKSLIGETAQLVFKHRRLGVPRPLDEITSDDIVSVSVGTFPVNGEMEQPSDMADPGTETSGEGPGVETQVAEEPVVEEEAEPGTETSEEGSEVETPVAEQPQVEEVEASEEPSEEETTPEEEAPAGPARPPALLVEFTDEGARRFEEIVARLRESLKLDEDLKPVEISDTTTILPSVLSFSVEGTETRTTQLPFGQLAGALGEALGVDPREMLGPAFIQQLDGSNRFALSLGGISANEAEAVSIFGDEPTVVFIEEVQGYVDELIGLTGDDLARSYAGQHAQTGAPIVNIEFKSRGARIFGELTQDIAGSQSDRIAIFLDDEELIAPTAQRAITTGTAYIEGHFTITRVKDLALLLESGALPVTIDSIRERDVDAVLGADSLSKSLVAGMVGLALVLFFMALYYRMPGIIAAVALVCYAAFILTIFKLLPVTLTLSGVAAAVLSIGMAVDANILIFERMKDELRAGRTLMSAINLGFNRAWPAIRDGNVSTLITCGILFWFSEQLGASVVQGFAATLAIGVLVSMFSAIVLSRTFLRVLATTRMSRMLGLFVPSGAGDLPQRRQQAAAADA